MIHKPGSSVVEEQAYYSVSFHLAAGEKLQLLAFNEKMHGPPEGQLWFSADTLGIVHTVLTSTRYHLGIPSKTYYVLKVPMKLTEICPTVSLKLHTRLIVR